MTPPTPPKPPASPPAMPKATPPRQPPQTQKQKQVRSPKAFKVQAWTGENEGEKLVIFGASGLGKTTLATMAPNPVFFGLDDGGRKIRDPRTGKPLNAVAGVNTYDDLRDALHQRDLWESFDSVVIDTITRVETLAEEWVIENVKTDKGQAVKSIEGFGWGKGYKHVLDAMRVIMQDLEEIVRAGKHVVLLAQESSVKIANAEGMDYLQDGPKLVHNNMVSCRNELIEWSDHVVRVGYLDNTVIGQQGDKVGKIASTDSTRAIYTSGARHFYAKSRTIKEEVISFEEESDDSFWKILGATR